MVKVVKTKFRNLFLLMGGFILLILFLQCFKIIENFAETTTPVVETEAVAAAKAAAAKAAAAAAAKAAAEKEAAAKVAAAVKAAKATAPKKGPQPNSITCVKGKIKTTVKGKGNLTCPSGYSRQ